MASGRVVGGGLGVVVLNLTTLSLDDYGALCKGCRHPSIGADNVIHSMTSSASALTMGSAAAFTGVP